jgi:precorrin-6B methylase 2
MSKKEYRLTIFLEEKEYKKLKLIAKNLRKHGTDNGSVSKLSAKLLSVLIEALDDDETESRLVLSSIMNKEKNIKTILENVQNDIDSLKIIEEFVLLANVKKAIKKMKEDSTETTEEKQQKETQTQKEEKTETKVENKEEEEEIMVFPDL